MPYSLHVIFFLRGHVNTNLNFCLSSAHCGCVLDHMPFPSIGNINAIANASPSTVHCGCVPNHKPYLLQHIDYLNAITNVSSSTVTCVSVPNHLPYSICRQRKHNHTHHAIHSPLWMCPKPCIPYVVTLGQSYPKPSALFTIHVGHMDTITNLKSRVDVFQTTHT